jgi:hypothetical protein
MLGPGSRLLGGRYELLSGPIANGGDAEAWIAERDYNRYLIKVWPYEPDGPDLGARALWDFELRTLYRVASTPGAEDSLVVLKDAGLDREARCFVMALDAPGLRTLTHGLAQRARHPWLARVEAEPRAELWEALERVARGLWLLHQQQIIHRNLTADSVFFDEQIGASSVRLGGFEWSIRLGVPATKDPPATWASPPEFYDVNGGPVGFRPELDWFAFGMLAVRCLLNVEAHDQVRPPVRYERILSSINAATARQLSPLEQELVFALIRPDPLDRFVRFEDIQRTISEILAGLRRGRAAAAGRYVLAIRHDDPKLTDPLQDEFGFCPDETDRRVRYNPQSLPHRVRLTQFVLENFRRNAHLHPVAGQKYYLLVGDQFGFRIGQYEVRDKGTQISSYTWDIAHCIGLGDLRGTPEGAEASPVEGGRLTVRTMADTRKDPDIRHNAETWERILPRTDRGTQLQASLSMFHEFVRATNQIELLVRDAETFPYRVVARDTTDLGVERLTLVEGYRQRPILDFCRLDGGMVEFLQTQLDSGQRDGEYVILSGAGGDRLDIPRVEPAAWWRVRSLDVEAGRVDVERLAQMSHSAGVDDEGFLRAAGMFGQVRLIMRRKSAIDRLKNHSYLLRSLSQPGYVYMDTGDAHLATMLPADQVASDKQAVIRDIHRVRPIYALQGPPGTGKTTLVAWLLRTILDDDPVAQILVTAQAHGAVDVLREKVRTEAFDGVPGDRQPLAVRLWATREDERAQNDEGSVERVSTEILEASRRRLERRDVALDELQTEWLSTLPDLLAGIRSAAVAQDAASFTELVRRSANLTYCTTSAGELEALADLVQFDWSIVEEAGKAHGFDLALPLNAGHRWLLIGDHYQLNPYRFDTYQRGIENLQLVVEALKALPDYGGRLVDRDWISIWSEKTPTEQADFIQYARDWLNVFRAVYTQCVWVTGAESRTANEPNGSAAGTLSGQYRMHPAIGELISETFYRRGLTPLTNMTVDEHGDPLSSVRHNFDEPRAIRGKAIVWLDMLWARDGGASEIGEEQNRPRYTNPREIQALAGFLASLRLSRAAAQESFDLAILSPYSQQVGLMNRRLNDIETFVPSVRLKQNLYRVVQERERRVAHTVDSFQGNQADVIAVSLVRNNTRDAMRGLGFLDEAQRINVLLSRAEQLLVLVGSWDFFSYQVNDVPLSDEEHTLWHWKQALTLLEDSIATGRAARLDGEGFVLRSWV